MLSLALVTLATLLALANTQHVQQPLVLLDLDPEEAIRYLKQPPIQSPVLAKKTATLPLIKYNDPRFRAGEGGPTNGHYWKNGNEIENTDDYVEEVYEATQFHGQDGLGAAAFGYSAPESSRLENIERDGNVQGSYSYKDANNHLIQVNYWADSEGFHQEDNLPKVELQPVTETPEVREARLAHEKAWQEAAAAAKASPDPSGEYDPSKYEVYDANEPRPSYAQQNNYNQQQQQTRNNQQLHQQYNTKPLKYEAEEEPTGPPRGFFYSFSYPVSVLVSKSQAGVGFGHGQVVDDDTIAVNADSSNNNARIQAFQRPVQIHDAQIPRYRNY